MADSPLTLAQLAESLRSAGVSAELRGDGGVSVSSASQDSRTISGGELFLAWRGTASDAHDFVREAVRRGAAAAMVERFVDVVVPQLRVDDGRRAAALATQLLVGDPTRRLRVAAVTGTNGKTTTTLLVRHLLSARWPAGAIGTLGVIGPDGSVWPGSEGLTTPGPVEIAQTLKELMNNGAVAVCIEASSHALDQRRLDGIRVDVAVFTNLTNDHMDYHRTRSAYLEAKARLLRLVRDGGGAVVNALDPAWADLPRASLRLVMSRIEGEEARGTPSFDGERLPDLVAHDVNLTGEGSRFRVRWGGDDVAVSLPLLGRFNVENALAAVGAALLLGMGLEDAALRLADAPQPRGRLEVTVREPIPVILDYAHTPDALERALETVRPLYDGRLVLVFGAGGDRDRGKRPEMGRAAVRGADVVIVTSDNPRTEDPDKIIDDIQQGMKGASFERIADRRQAIARALEVARPGDVILLAGKGHETYQIVGTERRHFDEREVVREILDSGRAA